MTKTPNADQGCFAPARGANLVATMRIPGWPRHSVVVSNDLLGVFLVRPYDETGTLVDDNGKPVRGQRWLSTPLPDNMEDTGDGETLGSSPVVHRDDEGAVASIDVVMLATALINFDPFTSATMPLNSRAEAVSVAAQTKSAGRPR